MNQYYELSLYEMNEDDTPELLEIIRTASKEECLALAHQLTSHLQAHQYLEIFNDDSQESIYLTQENLEFTSYKQLKQTLKNH